MGAKLKRRSFFVDEGALHRSKKALGVNPVPRTYVRGFRACPWELQNIHLCTYVQGVLWYGVKTDAEVVRISVGRIAEMEEFWEFMNKSRRTLKPGGLETS